MTNNVSCLGSDLLRWDEIFKGIKTAEGNMVDGDPRWTSLGRMLYALFG